jgi:hypothetical protein
MINYTHSILHKRPERYLINEETKEFINSQIHLSPAEIFGQLELKNPNITQKQIHYWWTKLMKKNYERNQNQLISAHLLLNENNYNIIFMDLNGDVKYIGFITPLFQQLINNNEILVDATCKYSLNYFMSSICIWHLNLFNIFNFIDKTNALKYELYAIIGQIDGAGFSAAYLFLDNAKKNNGIRTSILTNFFQELKQIGLKNIEYFLTDKDFSQINAAQSTWPKAKVQICLWHAKRALKKKLSDNELKNFNHHSLLNSNNQYDFIDTQWILFIHIINNYYFLE